MSFTKSSAFAIAAGVLWLQGTIAVAAGPSAAEDGKPGEQFLRMLRDSQRRPLALQAAIVRYAPVAPAKSKVRVDLVAAVHVADKSYYQQLNREFAGYDAVLYELVAPPGTKVPKGGRKSGGNPLSALQNGLKSLLELDFQLDDVDYTAKNMVHADMSPEQFSQSMRDRGESFSDLFARMLGYALARQGSGEVSDVQILTALFDKNRALKLRRIMAEQFQDMQGSLIVLEGPNGSTLISQRNKTALEVLRKQIAGGKRKIAIFYDAGHMPDFQKRLHDDFQLSPASVRWLSAWDLTDKTAKRPAAR